MNIPFSKNIISFKVSKKKRWLALLLTGAVLISIFFLAFTNYMVSELSRDEVDKVKQVAEAYYQMQNPLNDLTKPLQIIQSTTIPIIVANNTDSITAYKNVDETKILKDPFYLKKLIHRWKFFNKGIKMNDYQYIYFEEKPAITLLRYYPYIQLMLIGIFLAISYVAFSSSRRFEQNRVWVGMAKETAHQIGTPLSSLMAWVEYLKVTDERPGEEVITELEKDINRLQIITERFSKIGSTPELQAYNMYEVINEAMDYLRRRLSKKVNIYMSEESITEAYAAINKNLFDWVIENLTKNAVDAMVGVGEIKFTIKSSKGFILIDVKDTGKGIPRANFNSVFEPGFTTRKRGWGLGLSLTKRIIENYHSGEIAVKDSEVGKGTTFRIKLKEVEKA
jgi:two-component sensor histidine kinase